MRRLYFFILLLTVLFSTGFSQTAWISHGVANDDVYYVEHQYVGKIYGTDTLVTAPLTFTQFNNVYSISYYWTNIGTKAKISAKRLDSWFSGKWSVTKTLLTGDSSIVQTILPDTITNHPSGVKFIFYGYGTNDSTQVQIIIRLKISGRGSLFNKYRQEQNYLLPVNERTCIEQPYVYRQLKQSYMPEKFLYRNQRYRARCQL